MTIIGLKELTQNADDIAERASRGEQFVVVKRSKPIFTLAQVNDASPANGELAPWTAEAITRYRPALEALSDK
jgi:antitoxin (DNA-binding transcriptional repressor) of toxin-antitoxin stability system